MTGKIGKSHDDRSAHLYLWPSQPQVTSSQHIL